MPDEADALAGALTVTVDSIIVGARHRKDAGDLDSLAASIDQLGLLQPITVTPDRVLVCGWRRLEAVKRLGWESIKVWVRSGISDPVAALLAERDENTQRKDYTHWRRKRSTARSRNCCAKMPNAVRPRRGSVGRGGTRTRGQPRSVPAVESTGPHRDSLRAGQMPRRISLDGARSGSRQR
ncbi:ParB N-terminal domain-containing protein [Promicromonospora sp. MEB111]|uniref:ParB N-terminal domain-containing protein n=1 Tax=Promicromonospora sp. MEB111 TaxID=3040301 RepID=UPI00254D1C97|nr:ParB N-terminal domain-containing protein [Promicromonospora sp. MEB111]